MNQREDLDRMFTAWLDDPYTPPAPAYLGEVLDRTRHTRQRPAWASLERWLPMAVITRPAAAPMPQRLAWLMVMTLLVLALAAGIAFVGSQLLRATVAVPTGDAAVFAFGTWIGNDNGQTGGDIVTVRADGTELRRLTDGPGIRAMPKWSPDGTRIAYRLWNGGADSVEVIDAGGGDLRTLATNAQRDQYCIDWSLGWSPDGSSLIFPTRDGCADDYGLSIVATDGSSPAVPLLAPGFDGRYGTWSPDGTRIAFLGQEPGTSVGAYVIEASPAEALAGALQARRVGPDLSPTLGEGPWSGPRWSPDGTELLVTVGPTEEVYAVKMDGSGERLIAERAFNPNWSPDGEQIAFHRTVDPSEYFNNRPCTVRTWIIDAAGTNERQLDERADGCVYEPRWSPDGSRIADLLILATPEDPEEAFHFGVQAVDGAGETVILSGDGTLGDWQPVAAPLPPAPSFES
jgi:Tol biopolymer transport system component